MEQLRSIEVFFAKVYLLHMTNLADLDQRSRDIFKVLVETYLRTGDPVGSRNLAMDLSQKLSPATIRNVMAELENIGLLGSPHTSAGRLPTEVGLRLFVDGILEVQDLAKSEQALIEQNLRGNERNAQSEDLLARTGTLLSQLSKTASLVYAKKQSMRIKHIDFVMLSPEQAMVVLVGDDDKVENRLIEPPKGMTHSDMRRAANFINAHAVGKTIHEFEKVILDALSKQQAEVDDMMRKLVELGYGAILPDQSHGTLVVRGRANLIENQNEEQLEILKKLMDDLETKRDLAELLSLADGAQSVAVFIGSENKLFSMKGSSLVISPYMNGE